MKVSLQVRSKEFMRGRSKLVGAATALLLSAASLSTPPVPVVHADAAPGGGILGNATQVRAFADKVITAYGLFDKYVLGHETPTQLQQIQALILQSQTQIIAQMDALATANVNSEADLTVEQFESVDTMSPDQLAAFVSVAVKTVTDIKADLVAEQSKAAQDQLGFDLNIVGPIALFASAKAGQRTDVLASDLIQANRSVLTQLQPICTVESDVALGPDTGAVTGHPVCRSYSASKQKTGEPGTGKTTTFLVHGEIVADGVWPFTTGYHANFPTVTDYSEAGDIAMNGSSYTLARAALKVLSPKVPANPQIATALLSPAGTVGTPVGVFQLDPVSGAVHDGTFTSDTAGVFGAAEFSGWSPSSASSLVSLATGVTKEGRVHEFGLSQIGDLYQRWELAAVHTSAWSNWTRMADGPYNSVAVARNPNGALQVIATSTTGSVHATSQILNGDYYSSVAPNPPVTAVDAWTPWATLAGPSLTQVALTTDTSGTIHAVGVDNAGGMFHAAQTAPGASTWTSWTMVPHTGALNGVAAAFDFDHALNIFANDSSDGVYLTTDLGRTWTQFPGTVHSLSAVKEGGGSGGIELLGLDAHNNPLRNWGAPADSGLSWRGWTPLEHLSYTDNANHLWSTDRAGFVRDYGPVIKAGTTPVSVKLQHYDNQYETAFVGTDNMLWLIDPFGAPRRANGGLGVAAGSGPSIGASPDGGFQVAFHAAGTDLLWTYTRTSSGDDVASEVGQPASGAVKLMAGTSPSLAALTSGYYQIAYAAADGALYEWGGAAKRRVGNGLGVAAGTSPSIAAGSGGSYRIAFNAGGTNALWTVSNNVGAPDPSGVRLQAGTSPSSIWLTSGGWETAVCATDGFLWFAGDAGNYRASNGLGLAAGTSPTMVAMGPGRGFEAAFNANSTHHLWVVGSDNIGRDTQVTLGAAASPALTR